MNPRSKIAIAVGTALALVAIVGVYGWLRSGRIALRNSVHVVSAPVAEPRSVPPAEAPNVVVVIGCTVRKDQITPYAPRVDTTPFLDSFAKSGAIFEDMITAAPWTRPASVAILTGEHALNIGMVEPDRGLNQRTLHQSVDTVAEHFALNGWTTVGTTANPNTASVWNMHQGFDQYIEPAGTWSEGTTGSIHGSDLVNELHTVLNDVDTSGPVFVQAMFIDAHAPRLPLSPEARREKSPLPMMVRQYRRDLTRFDRAVQRLENMLKRHDITPENTIWVVVNDHGEGLMWPRHHGRGHGALLAPSAIKGVWLMRGPGIEPGTRVAGLASQVDIFPTIAELAGIPREVPSGQSHVEALATGHTTRDRAWSDTWFGPVSRAAIFTDDVMCQHQWPPRKHTGPKARFFQGCFDRKGDPRHLEVGPNTPLEDELEAWRVDRVRQLEAYAGTQDADLTDDMRKQLEALGYLGD